MLAQVQDLNVKLIKYLCGKPLFKHLIHSFRAWKQDSDSVFHTKSQVQIVFGRLLVQSRVLLNVAT